jgi:hypothetical protein
VLVTRHDFFALDQKQERPEWSNGGSDDEIDAATEDGSVPECLLITIVAMPSRQLMRPAHLS